MAMYYITARAPSPERVPGRSQSSHSGSIIYHIAAVSLMANHHCRTCSQASVREGDDASDARRLPKGCDTCCLDFESWQALEQHWIQSSRHFYCQRCCQHFTDASSLSWHYTSNHRFCGSCNKFFANARGLQEHLRQASRHDPDDFRCTCGKSFASDSNVRSHLESEEHTPRAIPCIFAAKGCRVTFGSKADMVAHLEADVCPSGATRSGVTRYVLHRDYLSHSITANALTDAHYASRPFICRDNACGNKRFSTFGALCSHAARRNCTARHNVGRIMELIENPRDGGQSLLDLSTGEVMGMAWCLTAFGSRY
ncbi:hypothetical protein PLICRDRAFT_36604 [Plicaturopsis crispa FD-325 SS-3]|nr:hypothetical protein PLICRDRAFT_36604 [Plicaturopsis crispa FD-325 SS-3]